MTNAELLEVLASPDCVCGGKKGSQHLLCGVCWASLPAVMQKALAKIFTSFGRLPSATRESYKRKEVALGFIGEEFFFVYGCAVDWVTWSYEKAWANARIILTGEVV